MTVRETRVIIIELPDCTEDGATSIHSKVSNVLAEHASGYGAIVYQSGVRSVLQDLRGILSGLRYGGFVPIPTDFGLDRGPGIDSQLVALRHWLREYAEAMVRVADRHADKERELDTLRNQRAAVRAFLETEV